MSHALISILLLLVFWTASVSSAPSVSQPGQVIGGLTICANGEIPKANIGVWQCGTDAGAGTGAPTTSTYITQTADGTLTAEFALSSLASCLLANTTGTGIPSCYGGTGPVANQFLRSINLLGVGTFGPIVAADIPNDSIALSTKTTGNYVGQLTAGTGVTLTNCTPGEGVNCTITSTAAATPDSVALTTHTTGNYVGQLTAGTNITLTGCTPGEGVNCTISAAGGGGGSSVILDLGDNGVDESAGLLEIATVGDTNSIFVEPSADKLLIDLSKDWPKADVADDVVCTGCVTIAKLSFDPATQAELDAAMATVGQRYADVALASTINLDLVGEETIDGILTSGSRVLVTGQTNQTENGCYVSGAGAWARCADMDLAAELVFTKQIRVNGGTIHARTIWEMSTSGVITLGTTNLIFTKIALGPSGEKLINKNVASGYAGLDAGSLLARAQVPLDHNHKLNAGTPAAGSCLGSEWVFDSTNHQPYFCEAGAANPRAISSLGDAYNTVTDGTTTASAAGSETFRFEAGAGITQTVAGGSPDKVTTALATANRTLAKSITLLTPTVADTNKIQLYWPAAVTLTRIACSTDTGTVSINFDERAEATPNTAGTNTLAAALVCDNNSQTTSTFADAGIGGDVPYNLQVTAIASAPTLVRIHLKATVN